MSARVSKFGDWAKAGMILQKLSGGIYPAFEAQLKDDGEILLKKIKDHITAQDLDWTPLSEETIDKKGSDKVYIETGYLFDNLEVRKVKSGKNNLTLFVGASAWKRTPDGEKLSDIMIWLEYGTDKIPARPLIRPTWDEVEPLLKKNWEKILKDLIEKQG